MIKVSTNNISTVGEVIRSLRKEKGLTLTRLSELSGVSDAAISRWENGQRQPKISDVELVLSALGAEVVIVEDAN